MKKTTLSLCFLLVGMGLFAKSNKNTMPITSEIDTISYAYGVSLAQQGVMQHLIQKGILLDTMQLRTDLDAKILIAAGDEKEVKKLKKEYAVKLDETLKANQNNITLLLKGISDAIADNPKDAAYKEGIAMGQQLQQMFPMFLQQLYGQDTEEKINSQLFVSAMQDGLSGATPIIENSFELINTKMQDAQLVAAKKAEQKLQEENEIYIADGNAFMDENKTKEGVVTLPDGLQYKILTQGTGAIPKATDRVKVHYRGSLIDGTVFDSSVDRGEPVVLGVNQVISGWTEALQLMPVGSKWMLYIPYDLAYGTRETGAIKPFSNLVFEVELLDIVE